MDRFGKKTTVESMGFAIQKKLLVCFTQGMDGLLGVAGIIIDS